MNLFGGIFNKRRAGSAGKRQGRGPSVVPVSPAKGAATPDESVPRLDVTIDESLLALSRELSGLSNVQVSQSAKERGWASLQRELERHPVRAAAGKVAGASVAAAKGANHPPASGRPLGAARPARSHTWRWALGAGAAAVAVIAALLGTYGGGLLQTADNGDHPTTITSVVSSDTTEPATTVTTESTTVTTQAPTTTVTTGGPSTTGVQPSTTQPPATTVTTGGSGTKGGGTTSTTQPGPTTTGERQYTAAEREGSAKAVATYLAELVITGNKSGAQALVAAAAQPSLAQMVMSLNDPYGYKVTGLQSLSTEKDTVRVTIEIDDRVENAQGQLIDVVKRFAIKVRVDSKGAVVVAINAG